MAVKDVEMGGRGRQLLYQVLADQLTLYQPAPSPPCPPHNYLPTVASYVTGCYYFRHLNPKTCGLLGSVFFGEMKFVLSNFLSNKVLSISYES